MTAHPILYSFRRCPFAMRARMALLIAGQTVAIREVILRDKPAELGLISAKATVPVLALPNGDVIDESLAIMRWALAIDDPEHWLQDDDHALIASNDGPFKLHLDRYKYPDRHGSDPIEHRENGLSMLADLDTRLMAHPNLCGTHRTLSDIATFPFVRQFAATDPEWFNAQPIPHVQQWLARHLASPLFLAAMIRLPQWHPSDPVTLFPAP